MHTNRDDRPVHILMAVYNGAAFLPEQLQSFAAQGHTTWELTASDDGSDDASRQVLERFAKAQGSHRVRVVAGPGRGSAANFLALLRGLPERPGWVALSDQDDRWCPERLERGLAALGGDDGPALYCARTWIADPALRVLHPSPRWRRAPGFRNALVQNIAAGNTMLLNPQAAALARAGAMDLGPSGPAPLHDWWLYQLISGAGGRIHWDPEPVLYYRQHGSNLIGANTGWRARITRLRLVLAGQYSAWIDTNIAALHASEARLTPGNRAILRELTRLRRQPLPARLRGFARLRLYRQTWEGQAVMWLALLLGRF